MSDTGAKPHPRPFSPCVGRRENDQRRRRKLLAQRTGGVVGVRVLERELGVRASVG
jgi:hypothetical protein